jgi:hypothetical protein
MMKKDKGSFSRKHPQGRKINQEIARAVKEKAKGGTLTCAQAFGIAGDLDVPPEEVGFTADCLEIGITMCQLGLFGYVPVRKIVKPAESVAPELEKAVLDALVENRLPCASSWEIAKSFRMARIRVSSACETLNLKISSCQLGAF